MITVVSSLEREGTLMRGLMPPTGASTTGGGRLYLFYDTPAFRPQTFAFDGVVLVETRQFATVDEAKAWVVEDIRQRDLLRTFGPMGRAS